MENMKLMKTLLKENAESDAQKIWREYLKQNIYKSTNDLTQTDASAFHDRYSPDSYPQYYNGSGENTSLNQEGIKIAYQFILSEKANAIKHKYYPRANDNGTSYYKQYPYIKLLAQKYKNDDIAYGTPKEQEFIKAFNRFMSLYMDKHFDIIDNKTPDKLSVDEFIDVYNDKYDKQKNDNSNNSTLQKGNYKVELVDTDKKARKYGKYTKWCITTGSFNNYASDTSPFYVFLREGYKNEEMIKGHNYPLDSYGLSMFAILIDEDGEWKQGTTRWNHGDNNEIKGADFVVTKNIVEQLVGQPFRNVCPPILTPEELEQRIKNSEIQKIGNLKFYIYNNKYYQSDDNGNLLKDKHWDYIKYDELYDFNDGFAKCKISNKGMNWLNENGNLVSPNQWFDDVYDFYNGFAKCEINNKGWNWINENGNLVSPNQWFGVVRDFNGGFAMCEIKNKYNWINENGNLVSPNQWFDDAGDFNDGFAGCKINNEGWNWINKNGEIISPNQWFDDVYDFNGGFAVCEINNEGMNWINENGNLVSPNQWFDDVGGFINGLARCKIVDWNWINEKGEIFLPHQWFDTVGIFNEGFARCEIKDKGWNWINEKGEIISPNPWFDYAYDFNGGFARCEIKDEGWNWVNKNGEIISPNQWFNKVYEFKDGFARCEIKDEGWNWVNKNGEIISPNLWFDEVDVFNDGFARCNIKDKGCNWVNKNGEIISPNQWFDIVYNFYEGFAKCKIDFKWNWVNKNGEIISPNQWFDDVDDFNGGFAKCEIGDKWYKIDTNGNIINKELSEQITKMKKMIKY
jgi:hypothetical protein